MTRRNAKKNAPSARLKVVCYARNDADVERVQSYASLYDLEIATVVRDLPTALAALHPGPGSPDGLLVYSLSRLGTTASSLGGLIDKYFTEASPLRLICIHDSIDSGTAVGRFALNVIWSVSTWERETAAEEASL